MQQNIVVLSSTEAEYVALTLASQEAIWLRRLLSSISFKQSVATQLYKDNQGANKMIADILTKRLAKERFQDLRKKMDVETSV